METMKNVLALAKARGIDLIVADDQLTFRCPAGAMTDELKRLLRNHKDEIIKVLKEKKNDFSPSHFSMKKAPISGPMPYYSMIIWDNLINGSVDQEDACIYSAVRINRPLRRNAVFAIGQRLMDRHECLRSTFLKVGNDLLIDSKPHMKIQVDREDLQGNGNEANTINAAIVRLVSKPVDLQIGPFFRIFTIELSATEHIVGIVVHHLICDGHSLGTLVNEFIRIYLLSQTINGAPVDPPVPFQYSDYLYSMKKWLESSSGSSSVHYWIQKLQGAEPTLLPPENGPVTSDVEVGNINFQIDIKILSALKSVARELGTTVNVLLLAAQTLALAQVSKSTDVTILAVAHMRNNAELNKIVGQVSDEVAYRVNLEGVGTMKEFVGVIQDTIQDALTHQPVPLWVIRNKLSMQNSPLIAPIFSFFPGQPSPKRPNTPSSPNQLQIRILPTVKKINFKKMTPPGAPYGLVILETSEGLIGDLNYPATIYSATRIKNFIGLIISNIERMANRISKVEPTKHVTII